MIRGTNVTEVIHSMPNEDIIRITGTGYRPRSYCITFVINGETTRVEYDLNEIKFLGKIIDEFLEKNKLYE